MKVVFCGMKFLDQGERGGSIIVEIPFEENMMCEHDSPRRPKVLLVEDDFLFQDLCRAIIGPHSECIVAETLEEAHIAIARHSDIAIFILDGYVPKSPRDRTMVTTLAFARDLAIARDGKVMMFAASGCATINREFVALGAQPTDKTSAYKAAAAYIASPIFQKGED